jgi:hypothetical protein
MRRLRLCSIVIAAAAASPAYGQCRLCDTPTVTRPESVDSADVKLQIEASLNFDRLVLDGPGDGVAVMRPDGSTSATGALSNVGPRAMVGVVSVHGEPGRSVRVDMPRLIELYSLNGGRMTFDEVQTDLSGAPRLDSAGNLTFRFGGRVRVSGDSEGDYRGDLPITVEYQ